MNLQPCRKLQLYRKQHREKENRPWRSSVIHLPVFQVRKQKPRGLGPCSLRSHSWLKASWAGRAPRPPPSAGSASTYLTQHSLSEEGSSLPGTFKLCSDFCTLLTEPARCLPQHAFSPSPLHCNPTGTAQCQGKDPASHFPHSQLGHVPGHWRMRRGQNFLDRRKSALPHPLARSRCSRSRIYTRDLRVWGSLQGRRYRARRNQGL